MGRLSARTTAPKAAVTELQEHLESVITLQHEALQRLLVSLDSVPFELADSFEDAANQFLSLADLIRSHGERPKLLLRRGG